MNNPLGLYAGFYRSMTVDNWRQAREAGFTNVELSIPGQAPLEEALAEADAQYSVFEEAGVRVGSVHLPFGKDLDPSLLDEEALSEAKSLYRSMLDWAGAKGIGIAVIHGSFEPIPENERGERLARAAESIRELGLYAEGQGVTLAVENLPRTCLGNCAAELLRMTDHGRSAKICFDVNHLFIESHKEFYTQVSDHVVTTHLSDYDGVDEKHWLVGDGVIDWQELVRLFRAARYEGCFLFELDEDASPKLGRPFTAEELRTRLVEAIQ